MANQLNIIAKRLPRVDGRDKVTGQARYAGDYRLPGMLHAKTLRSPYAHANIKSIDTSAAEKYPGVMAVVTYKDAPKVPMEADDEASSGGSARPSGVGVLDQTVRFVGDEVAAVAAVDRHAAEAAVKLIKVEYEVLPFVLDAEDAMKPGAPVVRAGGNIVGRKADTIKRGDVNKGFAEADFIFDDTYTTQHTNGSALEPRSCVANWQGDMLTVWKSSRNVYGDRSTLAKLFGLPLDNVRVIGPTIGSSYGNKDEGREAPLATMLSKKCGRPVMYEYTRQEELIGGRLRHAAKITLKIGLKKDMTVTAIYGKGILNTGPYNPGTAVTRRAGQGIVYLYTCENVQWDGYTVYTNAPTAGSHRGLGAPQGHFALESAIDKICYQQGWDPLEFRIKNGVKLEGQPGPKYTPVPGKYVPPQLVAGGIPFSSNGLLECLQKGAAAIGWSNRQKNGTATGTKRYGIGMACFIYQTGQASSSAIVKVNGDGTVNLLMGTIDVGQGSSTVMTAICAEELGVPYEAVRGTFADTQVTPYSHITAGSTCTFTSGMAAKVAAADAKRQILEAAAPLLKAKVEEMTIQNGKVIVIADPTKSITLAKAVATKGDGMIIAKSAIKAGSEEYIVNSFGVHLAEVEVDTETGEVKLLNFVAVHDSGRPINLNTIESQMYGGSFMGIGFGTMEEIMLDPNTGGPVTNDLCWFRVPTIMDMPKMTGILADVVDPVGPYGAKAMGEPGLVPTAPAIANAVFNAIGVQIPDIPITPTKVLAALKAAKA